MDLPTIFTVTPQELGNLAASEAVDVFRELVWLEATALGIPKANISISTAINVDDGGVDAEVRDVDVTGGQGIIAVGLNSYQIKTGDFRIHEPAQMDGLLFNESKKRGRYLKPRVKRCFDSGGTFVVVLFGTDQPENREDDLADRLRDLLRKFDASYGQPRIRVWQQNQIMGFLRPYPSLALRVRRIPGVPWTTHRSWRETYDDMQRPLKLGKAQTDFIDTIQQALRSSPGAVHLRVCGEPGIGKTRLTLEATGAEDIGPSVLYRGSPGDVLSSSFLEYLLSGEPECHATLVVDECDFATSIGLWNRVKHAGRHIRLITIYHDFDETTGETRYPPLPPLDDQQVAEIIEAYGVSHDAATRWAELCGGSPRMAHVIGLNLREHPDDLLRTPDTEVVWERYIAGTGDANSEATRRTRMVLRTVALFRRFGVGKGLEDEAAAVAQLVADVDGTITRAQFMEIVRDLQRRKILQGQDTLYITPRALHIKLWMDYCDNYGLPDIAELSARLPAQLQQWLLDMFKYAGDSAGASSRLGELLGPDGPFGDWAYLQTTHGAAFFEALAEARPEAALRRLQALLSLRTPDELQAFTVGRREVVHALEMMAVHRALFAGAARLLLALAEAENERWANNASGVFVGLFSPGPDPVAPTAAPPSERFPVLREALLSGSKARRLLALRACGTALTTQSFARTVGPEHQGLRPRVALWKPATWGELFDAYRAVWRLLCDQLDGLLEDERRQGAEILLRQGHGLLYVDQLCDMVMSDIAGMIDAGHVGRDDALRWAIRQHRNAGEGLPQRVQEWLAGLEQRLTGSGFRERLKRYVGLGLSEDHYRPKEEGDAEGAKQLRELAQLAVATPSLLRPEIPWLVTEARQGYAFGYQLGQLDPERALLPEVIEGEKQAGAAASNAFLGGYLRAVFEQDRERWEFELDNLAADPALAVWVPSLTAASGMSSQAANRVLRLAVAGVLQPSHLNVFIYGGAMRELPAEIFARWVEWLLGTEDANAASSALNLASMYVHQHPGFPLPRELGKRLLLDARHFGGCEDTQIDVSHEGYEWTELAKAYVACHPEDEVEIAVHLLEHLGEGGTIVAGMEPYPLAIANDVTRRRPQEMWPRISRYLGPPIDERAFRIANWLRGEQHGPNNWGPVLPSIPLPELWAWVDEDAEHRAWYLATLVPPFLSDQDGQVDVLRQLLMRYGDREDVRRNVGGMWVESWMGSESAHWDAKRRKLREVLEKETDANVRLWLDEQLDALDQMIESARIREEREF